MLRLRHNAPGLVAAALWALALIVVRATGQGFIGDYLGYGWQLVPYEVLRDDPFGSVWYLHIQPPIFNLVIGSVGAWSPFSDAFSFQLMQLVAGALMAYFIAQTLVLLHFRSWLATVLTAVSVLNPDVMRNALEPTYEVPVGALLACATWIIARHHPGRAGRSVIGLSAVLTGIVLTRSLYHPLWLIVLLTLAAWHWRAQLTRQRIIVAALIPLLLVGGWMLKNQLLFGRATLSSWFGMNLQRAVIPVLPEADRIQLHNDGKISDIAMIGPFGNYDLYRDAVPPCTPEHAHPAVSTEVRQFEVVVPNLNFECFLPVYDQAGADAWTVIRQHPGAWWDGRVWSMRTWFASNRLADTSPSWPYRQLGNAYQVIRLDLPSELSTNGWGQPIYGRLTVATRFSLTTLQLTMIVGTVGLVAAWRILRRRRDEAASSSNPTERGNEALVSAFVGLTALFTFVVGVIGELGEQARFRTMTDPLVYALGFALVVRWLGRRFGWTWVEVPAPTPTGQTSSNAQP